MSEVLPQNRPAGRGGDGWRPGRRLAAVVLMSIWVVLPLLPAIGVLLTWWLGIS